MSKEINGNHHWTTQPMCSWVDEIQDESGLPIGRAGKVIDGLGREAPIVVNKDGGKQSFSPCRCDLLPAQAVLHVAAILKEGAAKYGDNNWRKLSVNEHMNHAVTHAFAFLAGDKQDDHLGHAACRLLMALETYKCE